MREDLKELSKEFDKSEDDLKSLQSGVGQIVGEVLRQLTEEKCMYNYCVVSLCWFVYSYCEGIQWTSLCSWLPQTGIHCVNKHIL